MGQQGMSRASTPTLLSLDRWARILQINPVHFSGGVGSPIWPANGACQDIWPQYSWQTDEELVGREEVAMAIANAEQDIKNALGYSPAATWEIDEAHPYSINRHLRTFPSTRTEFGMVVGPGRRAVTLIDDNAAVTRSDPNADGWAELATVTVSTTVTDVREVKVYFAGHDGDPEWEIRPLRSVTISSGVATILIDAWLLFDPDLWEAHPNTEQPFAGIDIADSDNFVTVVDVYREYNDTSLAGVTFFSGGDGLACCGGAGCDVCAGSSYEGCFSVRDERLGTVAPFPATYNGDAWTYYYPSHCERSQRISLNYYAGLRDKAYLRRKSLDPLSHYMAEAIVWLSVARLPDAICNCNNIRDRIEDLQKDASMIREGGAVSPLYARFEKMDTFHNPFGYRVGEVKAWQRVIRLQGEIGDGGAL